MNVDGSKFNAYTTIQDQSLNKTLIYTPKWEIATYFFINLYWQYLGHEVNVKQAKEEITDPQLKIYFNIKT